jgi:hypothetical protein
MNSGANLHAPMLRSTLYHILHLGGINGACSHDTLFVACWGVALEG